MQFTTNFATFVLRVCTEKLKIKSPVVMTGLFISDWRGNYTPDRLELISLKTLPMIGPRTIKAAITTIATKTRISAYSTRPWPFSLGENNILKFLLSFGFHRKASSDCFYCTLNTGIGKRIKGLLYYINVRFS